VVEFFRDFFSGLRDLS